MVWGVYTGQGIPIVLGKKLNRSEVYPLQPFSLSHRHTRCYPLKMGNGGILVGRFFMAWSSDRLLHVIFAGELRLNFGMISPAYSPNAKAGRCSDGRYGFHRREFFSLVIREFFCYEDFSFPGLQKSPMG